VRVTSTLHPLFNQLLPATGFKRWRGDLLLVVVLPDGAPGTIAASATDLLGDAPADGCSTVLTVDGVQHLHMLVGALRPQRRSTSRPKTRK
jgi:hypothetical protein